MKKYFMLLAVAAGITTASFAQTKEKEEKDEKYEKKEQVNVPAVVKQAFTKQFPGATAKWEKEDGKYEANFKHMHHEMSALFETNGSMAESELEIKTTELPVSAQSYIKERYKNAAIKESAKITKANGEVNYEAEVNGKDLIFDAAGRFLKEMKG